MRISKTEVRKKKKKEITFWTLQLQNSLEDNYQDKKEFKNLETVNDPPSNQKTTYASKSKLKIHFSNRNVYHNFLNKFYRV